MNFKKSLVLMAHAAIAAAAFTSTAVQADIPGNYGWHYVGVTNTNKGGASLQYYTFTAKLPTKVSKPVCLNIKPNQTVKTLTIVVTNDTIVYAAYPKPNCTGQILGRAFKTSMVRHDNLVYWHLNF